MTEQHGTYHPTRRAADPIDTDATASDLTGADQTAIDPAATDLTYTDPTASDPTATGPTATEPANTNPTPAGPASDPESAAPARQQAPARVLVMRLRSRSSRCPRSRPNWPAIR